MVAYINHRSSINALAPLFNHLPIQSFNYRMFSSSCSPASLRADLPVSMALATP